MNSETKEKIVYHIGFIQRFVINENDSISERVEKFRKHLDENRHMIGDFDFDEDVIPILKDFGMFAIDTKTYVFEQGYVPWLNGVRNNIDFHFYQRYEQYLIHKKHWSPKSVSSINSSTDIILDHIRNPKTSANFMCKGLVIGDIQSGKTANYSALINKALDVGYKLIVIFTGTTNDLRKQTQYRVDSEILGYETKEDATHGCSKGVAAYGSKSVVVDCLTHDDIKGDLKYPEGVHSLTNNSNPVVAVIKKNTKVLSNLYDYINGMQENCYTEGKLNVPVLIIDDEADLATPNTKDSELYEDASAINKGIRKVMYSLNRVSYVAYTATPFANVFIDPYYETEEGRDLYPEDFIICLPTPYNYCGVEKYFSITSNPEDDGSIDLCVPAEDFDDFFDVKPLKITKDTVVDKITESLDKAIQNFIIAASVKKQRGIIEHNSMLIHIASIKNPSNSLVELIKTRIDDMYTAFKYEKEEKKKYRIFWEENIKKTSQLMLESEYKDEWKKIEPFILKTFENIRLGGIRLLNGDSKDVINYSDLEPSDFIIVGGNRLSRGLTLEGLIVSYFLRSSKQYDALLQMGRWFGYRDGWLDLCRIYTSQETIDNFLNISESLVEFRSLIEDMNNNDKNPLNFGLMVKTCPNLIPTARNKMRSVQKMYVSYSGRQSQTTTFEANKIENNLKETNTFISKLNNKTVLNNNKTVFKKVSSEAVIDYLNKYSEGHEVSDNSGVINWINYIKKSNDIGEMVDWSVILSSLSKEEEEKKFEIGGCTVYKASRNDRDAIEGKPTTIFKLRVATDPTDFKDALYDIKDLKDVKTFNSSDPLISKYFTREKAILSIQITDIHYKGEEYRVNGKTRHKLGKKINNGENVVSLTIWFPKTYGDTNVEYYVTKIKLDEMRGE